MQHVVIRSVFDKLEPKEKGPIDALEWFESSQSFDLLKFSNRLARRMLIEGKVHAVKAILDSAAIDMRSLESHIPECTAHLQEHSEYKLLISSLSNFESWARVYKQNPDEKRLGIGMHYDQWVSEMRELARFTVERLNQLLSGDIFGEAIDVSDDYNSIMSELNPIRTVYIPDLVMKLHEILFNTREHIAGYLKFI